MAKLRRLMRTTLLGLIGMPLLSVLANAQLYGTGIKTETPFWQSTPSNPFGNGNSFVPRRFPPTTMTGFLTEIYLPLVGTVETRWIRVDHRKFAVSADFVIRGEDNMIVMNDSLKLPIRVAYLVPDKNEYRINRMWILREEERKDFKMFLIK